MDPANKSLAFNGFTSVSAAGRRASIEIFLASVMGEAVNISQVEHIFKGPSGDRKMSALSVVEFPSRVVREQVLKKVQDGHKGVMSEDDKNEQRFSLPCQNCFSAEAQRLPEKKRKPSNS